MPFFVGALNALYSFSVLFRLMGAKIMKNGLCKEKKVFFNKMLAEWENDCIFASESPSDEILPRSSQPKKLAIFF